MKAIQGRLFLLIIGFPSACLATGFETSSNFTVFAPDQATAEAVLAQAERYRKEAALEWLGKELPPSVGPTTINVRIADDKDEAFTWAIDSPRRSSHKIWVTASRDRALGSTLRHEITHTVLATRYPGALPEWAEEGAASLNDNPKRQKTRQQILDWYVETGHWPSLQRLLNARVITPGDAASYSVAASLTRYLLSRKDKTTFLTFARDGMRDGWERAVRAHYGISTVGNLQAGWQAWSARKPVATAAVLSAPARRSDSYEKRFDRVSAGPPANPR